MLRIFQNKYMILYLKDERIGMNFSQGSISLKTLFEKNGGMFHQCNANFYLAFKQGL